jgi:hypothetical protein
MSFLSVLSKVTIFTLKFSKYHDLRFQEHLEYP